MNSTPLWASESFWKKAAIWVTGLSFVALIFLTLDTLEQTKAGGSRVPAYSVINKQIDYKFDEKLNKYMPVIGGDEFLFGKKMSESEAESLVALGKKTTQSKNCMNCHTLLGNGAYYAPDLTKAWLDKGWINKDLREQGMISFLMNPSANARTFGSNRRMPDLGITEDEARGIIAFLKWMSSIDTNGFPHRFITIEAEDY